MKNKIEACWDSKAKKFVKADSVKEETFKAIKKASSSGNGKKIALFAGIGALVTGVAGYITAKLLCK